MFSYVTAPSHAVLFYVRFLAAQVGAVGGIRTLEPLSGYTISSRARYDHFDTTAYIPLLGSGKQHYVL